MKSLTIEEYKKLLNNNMETFTIAEFKNYILSKDSLGDVMYYLSEENVRKANDDLDDLSNPEEDDYNGGDEDDGEGDLRDPDGGDILFNPFN